MSAAFSASAATAVVKTPPQTLWLRLSTCPERPAFGVTGLSAPREHLDCPGYRLHLGTGGYCSAERVGA